MNLLGNTSVSNTMPKFNTENCVKVKDESGDIIQINILFIYK